jgi:hypothetical protein
MKNILVVLCANLPSLAAVVGATVAVVSGIPGWWMFLIVALFLHTSVKITW